ncbi:MAG: hypothetical protein MJY44_03785 [Bacteroidales bacterium]|nr:hypothetical protein [Bacteroidales bacterium]
MNYTGPKLNPFQTVGYAVLVGVTFLLSRLPLGFHRRAGDVLGFVAGRIVRYRRDVVVKNLARAFPDRDMDWIEDIVSRFYRQFGRIFTEAVWFGSCTDAEKLKKSGIIRLSNPEALNGYYHAGRSVVVLFSHSSNWEIMAGYPCVGDGLDVDTNDVYAVFKRQSHPVWDKFFFRNRIAPFGEDYDGLKEAGESRHCALAGADVPRI